MTRRTQRLNDLIQEEIGQLLLHQLRDPRLSSLVTVTAVEVAPDLSLAKIFISVLGGEEERQKAMGGMDSASGYIRRELARRLRLRHMPQLSFHYDDSIQKGVETSQLLRGLREQQPPSGSGNHP